jgi:L-asparaginase
MVPGRAVTTRPRVAMIVTGGTIDSVGSDPLDLAFYTERHNRLGEGELLSSLRGQLDDVDLEEVPFEHKSSSAIGTGDWLRLAHTVDEILAGGRVDGLVVVHGTDTLEETAYFLHLVVRRSRPVVLTGAMRPASGLSSDGPLNLVRAVQVASCRDAGGRGALVVMNDTIFSARDVTKTATFRVQAFGAPDSGPVGYADADGRIVLYHDDRRSTAEDAPFPIARLDSIPRVDVVVSYVGADGTLIDAAVAAGAGGIVSAGTGSGRPTPAEAEALSRASLCGVLVCQSSRVGSGRVARSPSMREKGVVAADNLRPWKAKVLLSLALTATRDPEEIQQLFDRL